jgi:hypothetical protein
LTHSEDSSNRPPLGLMPEWRHKELRLGEVRQAVKRYIDAKQPVPINWIVEEYCLREWLENRAAEKEEAKAPPTKEQEIIRIECDLVKMEEPKFPCLFVGIQSLYSDKWRYDWSQAEIVECKIRGAGHYFNVSDIKVLATTEPKSHTVEDKKEGCGTCGGELATIRGKYPGTDKRKVCATCNTERLEQINEISSTNYGKACKNN